MDVTSVKSQPPPQLLPPNLIATVEKDVIMPHNDIRNQCTLTPILLGKLFSAVGLLT